MILTMEPKRLALGDVRVVTDESGQVWYVVKGRWSIRGKQLRLYDTAGKLMARVLRPKPDTAFTHNVYLGQESCAELWEDGPYRWHFVGPEWTVDGVWEEAAFRVQQRGETVLRIIGRPTYWGMTYTLDFRETEPQTLTVACGLALVCVCEKQRGRAAQRRARAGRMH